MQKDDCVVEYMRAMKYMNGGPEVKRPMRREFVVYGFSMGNREWLSEVARIAEDYRRTR